MPRKLTLEEVNAVLKPRGFKLLGEYKNGNTKTEFQCSKNHTWFAKFQDIKNSNSGCPHCAGLIKLTKEDINKKLEGTGVKLIGQYISSKTKTEFQCSEGHIWEARPGNVCNAKSGCPFCLNEGLQKTNLYIFTSSLGVKIGVSTNPAKRLAKIKSESNLIDLKLYREYKIENYSKALAIEVQCHRKFKNYNLDLKDFTGCTEFFSISPELVEEFIYSILGE